MLYLCNNYKYLTFLFILKYSFKILIILLPLLIIIKAFIPFIKAFIKVEDVKIFIPGIIKSLIIGIIIFILPSFTYYILDKTLGEKFTSSSFVTCFERANKKDISFYKENDNKDENDENEIIEEDVNDNNVDSFPKGEITIHVGDSRTVGMCVILTSSSFNDCTLSTNGPLIFNKDIFIAESGMSYDWFSSVAVPAVNKIINNSNVTYNIVSYMGVNNLLFDINNYINKYNELANGSWKDHNIILVSINPVDEELLAKKGYNVISNTNIIESNNKLNNNVKNNNVKYCDTYNEIKDSFFAEDGLHYDSKTYISIYNKVKTCI